MSNHFAAKLLQTKAAPESSSFEPISHAGHLASHLASPRTRLIVLAGMLALVVTVTLIVSGGLAFAPVKDELHFLDTAQLFAADWPPSVERLRAYPEVITPLAFVLWGGLEYAGADILVAGRLLNLVLAISILWAVTASRTRESSRGLLVAVGLLIYPYLIGMGTHLYTDMIAAALGLAGFWAHERSLQAPSLDRAGTAVLAVNLPCALLALLAWTAAIATRQYLVAVPAACCVAHWLDALRQREPAMFRAGIVPALASLTVLGWFAFFGGLAPEEGRAVWFSGYPAPMAKLTEFIPEYALYALAALGAYVVVPEWLLLRRCGDPRALLKPLPLFYAVLLAIAFALAPPLFHDWNGGIVDRAVRSIFPPHGGDIPRMAIYWALAWITLVRFGRRLDLGFWLVALHVVLFMKTQLPWDKYYLPLVVLLWWQIARLDSQRDSDRLGLKPLRRPSPVRLGTLPSA
jgi:hypothetical protein